MNLLAGLCTVQKCQNLCVSGIPIFSKLPQSMQTHFSDDTHLGSSFLLTPTVCTWLPECVVTSCTAAVRNDKFGAEELEGRTVRGQVRETRQPEGLCTAVGTHPQAPVNVPGCGCCENFRQANSVLCRAVLSQLAWSISYLCILESQVLNANGFMSHSDSSITQKKLPRLITLQKEVVQ